MQSKRQFMAMGGTEVVKQTGDEPLVSFSFHGEKTIV
jgi:hypothetical protein